MMQLHFFRLTVLVFCMSISANCLVEDVLDVLHIVKEVGTTVLKTWEFVEQTGLGESVELPIMRQKQKNVLKRLSEISRNIEATEVQHSNNAAWTIESVNNFIKQNTRLELQLNEVENIIHVISSRFKQMEAYESTRYKFEEQTIIDFAEWTVSPNAHAIHYLLERLHLLLIGTAELRTQNKNVLNMVAQQLEDSKEHICATKQSAQQFLFSLYSDIALTELKGYTMMQFSWMMLRVYNKGNFTDEATIMREDYEKRSNRTLSLLGEVMKRADRSVWRCDPTKFIIGENYDEVTRLLQGYIENEVDINPEATCREDCGFYEVTKNHGCFKGQYCSKQPKCNGQLLNCRFYDSDMWICPSARNSTRRYEYIQYENGRVLGKKDKCVRGTTKVDSWWRYLFWHCSYCMCLCDEQGIKSDRYFNLRETISNIDDNMVITGLRLVKRKRVFHLQIQEGKLLPRGNINASTVVWKNIEDYQVFDRDVINRRDYHTLDANTRAVDLDDIITDDPTFVVTGVRFQVIGTHLNLQAHFSEYKFDTGELVSPKSMSFWKSNDNTDFSDTKRTPLIIKNPDVPTRSLIQSHPTSQHNQFIEFTHSDFDKDAAQTTVPFIDIQEVVSNPPVPLSGIGIYHKGRNEYGGFLGPKLITYDFAPHVAPPQIRSQG